MTDSFLAFQYARSLQMEEMIIRVPFSCQFMGRIVFERILGLIVDDSELNLFPLVTGTDGRLIGRLRERGLLEGFQVTADGKPAP